MKRLKPPSLSRRIFSSRRLSAALLLLLLISSCAVVVVQGWQPQKLLSYSPLTKQQQQQQHNSNIINSINKQPNICSRRAWFHKQSCAAAVAVVAASSLPPLLVGSIPSAAAAAAVIETTAEPAATKKSTRQELLDAIDNNKNDKTIILDIISRLSEDDPSQRQVLTKHPERLDGVWELVWSFGAEQFSPLLQLPYPLRPLSYQYFGPVAARQVGEGRIAQGLTGGILTGDRQLWLSSGAVPVSGSVLEIQPPFRLQIGKPYNNNSDGNNNAKRTLVEAGSDADFRKTNGRTTQAQQAGKNKYEQLYVDAIDGPGAIRISTVTEGDPVIVGAVFVHRRL